MSHPRELRPTLIALAALVCTSMARAAEFGAKVVFERNVPIDFHGLALTYLGQRHVSSPVYPRGMEVFDFRVSAGSATQTVSWSAGTGDIGPTRFRIDGHEYDLELARSDKLGPLKKNELVLSRVP